MHSSLVLGFSYFSATGLLLGHFKTVNYASRMDGLHMFSYQLAETLPGSMRFFYFVVGSSKQPQTWFSRKLRAIIIGEVYGKALRRKAGASADYPKNDEKLKRKMLSFAARKTKKAGHQPKNPRRKMTGLRRILEQLST